MKNDVSFLIGGILNLYEHQSTYNPNMPMRGLLYLAKLYERYIQSNKINIFRSQLRKFPNPQYIVFYNGMEDEPDQIELKLSDAFEHTENYEPCLEGRAIMLNINYGHNKMLMERCRKLEEYAIFIATIRRYRESESDITEAVNLAVDECIKNNILREILTNSKSEVVSMVLTTFDREVYEKDIKEEGYMEGYTDGTLMGGIRDCVEMCQEFAVSKEETIKRLVEKFSLEVETAEGYIEEFWK